ncbi:DMT family transporter [Rhizobium glycinendophyticum]|uniref:DMT family transporter n=1 Tax=Rhizobium glycinendophyticum TaxID=2589807 RepID=A0A504UDQ9_9HYPH|nr:DMT family transporter [Rhizobium glycinendophyticum]TPP11220.1 DMT family transporter [Rhizobium glycinendophyticum]
MTDHSPAAAPSSRLAALFLLLLLETGLIITWSAGFIGVRFASDHAPIFLILLWRSLVSGLLLLPLALTWGPGLRWRHVIPQMLYGALAMSGYLAGFALAIGFGVPTGLVALITDMLPLAVAVLSWPILGQALNGRQWLGSLIGFAGVLIASAHSLTLGTVPLWAYGLPVLGTLSLAVATLLQKRSPTIAMPVHQSLCIQCLSAAAIFSVFAGYEGSVLPVMNAGFIGGVLWLALVATLGSWTLYYMALRRSSPARVTSVVYLSPPVTMIWAWLMFGEPLSLSMAIGLFVSLAGVIIVARAQPKTGVQGHG